MIKLDFKIAISSIVFIITIFIVPISCEKEDSPNIPFGYDPNYNYLEVLRSSPDYAFESTEGYIAFTYQEPNDTSLIQLKNLFNLDSVAGEGNELDRIFNLFNWAHKQIRHDGNNSTPGPENSIAILQHVKETGRGVNCVMMAIVLNEVYLSIGIKSRVIQGNARKFIFNGDWHSFNIVYSETLSKWIFLDLTMKAFFTDDKGNFLSISEIRDHLIMGKELNLNPEANYNSEPVDEDDYLNYLSKNLYRFSCSVDSRFGNYEIFHLCNPPGRIYYHLDPGGDKQDGLGLAVNFFTSNPDFFWAKPY